MTRGRRKDLTIPPSRALIQQRDYRARKAQYLSDLEQRVRHAEEENMSLRLEVSELKQRLSQVSGGPSTLSSEVLNASADLAHHLSEATSSLSRFQRVAFNQPPLLNPADLKLASPGKTPGRTNATGTYEATSTNPQPGPSQPSVYHGPLLAPHHSPSPPMNLPRARSASDEPRIDPSRERASGSSELPSMSTSSCSVSPPACSREDSLPHPRSSPQGVSPLLPPPPPVRRDLATRTHPFTLPPLRLPSPADHRYLQRPIRSFSRSHPYAHSYDSFTSSRLTPTTWSEIYYTDSQSRSSLPSHSESSDEEEEDDDDEDPTHDTYDRDYAMRDDSQDARSGPCLYPSTSSSPLSSGSKFSDPVRVRSGSGDR